MVVRFKNWIRSLNIIEECRVLRWKLWQCPPFLFLLMGFVIIISMLATYLLATRYVTEPEFAALIVIFVTAILLILGTFIINGFNKVVEADRMKSEFISLISHQLRSPLSIFRWTLDLFKRDIQSGTLDKLDKIENNLAVLSATTEQMIKLVNSLLEVSRIEARTFVLKKEVFSLETLTRKVMESFMKLAEASNIAISLKAEENLPQVITDPQRIEMVVQNLIDNAIRYTPSPGNISIKIEKDDFHSLRWSISDSGRGIPASEQRYIFQKFFRGRNTKGDATHGTGIGLYIAKTIIEAAGGKIGFVSNEGRGSTFWFILPLAKTQRV